jgi:predicted nucleotidyltransferase
MYELLEQHREQIADLCRRYHVRELSVFGSVARGDFHENSDIDLLVEFEPEAKIGLLEFIGLQLDLSDVLGQKVDLVSKPGLKPLIRDNVLAEARLVCAS